MSPKIRKFQCVDLVEKEIADSFGHRLNSKKVQLGNPKSFEFLYGCTLIVELRRQRK